MNNKGQVLALFALILPTILLLVIIGIEFGNTYCEKQKNINIIKEAIQYGLKNNDEQINEKLTTLIEKNIKNIKSKNIITTEDEIEITITTSQKIFGKDHEIKYNYKEQKQIVKEG